ncbi:manganese transporter [Pelobium manganitolerans]|uniref:Manganese transporter n=1 Tax=Pelobium manganitolerans TaxID=1842495 RepID=A0A419S253_9SPHI|nr:Nramp family divalent metal transporter [Pelobium manganitolerans]RKD12790.1 manganese transporter [Pelobium manganitolerans]
MTKKHFSDVLNRFQVWLFSLGPGIITAALVFGPSKMTITSKMGADYRYSLLWVVVLAIFFMIVFTRMSTRIGMVSPISLLSLIRKKFGNKIAVSIGLGIFLVTASFQAGNSIGVGIAIGEATETNPLNWVVIFNLLGIVLLFFRSFYKLMEKLMIALVAIMLFSFLATFFLIEPNVVDVAEGFVPSVPSESMGLIIAFIASCFSLVGAFYQSYLVQERKKSRKSDAPEENPQSSSTTGIVILGLMATVVLICAGSVLNPQGLKVNSASEMALALEPLFGSSAAALFFVGLFGASFSSLVGNATVGGTLLGDALGYGSNLNIKAVKGFIALVMIVGAGVALKFGKLPLELIVLAQSVTIFLVPFIGVALYLIANDPKIMGNKSNNTFAKITGAIGLLIVAGLAISSLINILI